MNEPTAHARRGPAIVLTFAVLLFVGFSLPHLFDPPIGTHSWRQAIATSMARLYSEGQPFHLPRAENCGAEPDVFMGSEFPLYAWLLGRFGSGAGIHLAGRVMGLLSVAAWGFSLFAIARYLLRRVPEPARSAGAAAAGCFVVASPLFRFYGISFMPDLEAHALALLGIAVWLGPLREREAAPAALSPARFFAGAALVSLGCMTKLIALPHLALAGLVLLDRSRSREGVSGFKSPRPWLFGALLLVLVAVPIWLWYVRWVPALKASDCDVVWLPKEMDDNWLTATLKNSEWRSRLWEWGALGTLGPLWIACLAGLPLAAMAGWRGLIFGVWLVGAAGSFVRLGWHSKQHDYDLLLLLPMMAVGFGLAYCGAVRAGARALSRLSGRVPLRARQAAPYAVLAAVVLVFGALAHGKSRRHFEAALGEVELETALDKVLPEDEPIHYFGNRHDPRTAYFAHRKARATEPWLYCQKKRVRYDCALAPETNARLAPCNERPPAVVWPERSLVCGIMRPDEPIAPQRVVARILERVEHRVDRPLPGAGRVLGLDVAGCGRSLDFVCAGNLPERTYFDVYVLADGPASGIELLVDGKPLDYQPKAERWIAGSVMVIRAEAPPSWSKVELRSPRAALELAGAGRSGSSGFAP
ncbi:MAG: ArnT family glycosyltransferase [Myxococcales bacterium]|jgi:hypothetical protein